MTSMFCELLKSDKTRDERQSNGPKLAAKK